MNLIKAVLRFLGFNACPHTWEPWSSELSQFGHDHYQRRRCTGCGMIQQRKVGWATKQY